MNPEVLTEANRRLDSPPAMDFAVSRNMGLFVVGRLAARHGIKVGCSRRGRRPDRAGLAAGRRRERAGRRPRRRRAGLGCARGPRPGLPAGTSPDDSPALDRRPARQEAATQSMWSAPVWRTYGSGRRSPRPLLPTPARAAIPGRPAARSPASTPTPGQLSGDYAQPDPSPSKTPRLQSSAAARQSAYSQQDAYAQPSASGQASATGLSAGARLACPHPVARSFPPARGQPAARSGPAGRGQ